MHLIISIQIYEVAFNQINILRDFYMHYLNLNKRK